MMVLLLNNIPPEQLVFVVVGEILFFITVTICLTILIAKTIKSITQQIEHITRTKNADKYYCNNFSCGFLCKLSDVKEENNDNESEKKQE